MSDFQTAQGEIEATGREGRAIKVGGEFYSAYKSGELEGFSKGDYVKFQYVINGKWRNIRGSVKRVEKSEAPKQEAPSMPTKSQPYNKDRMIVRQNSASNASRIVAAFVASGKVKSGNDAGTAALVLAKRFEAYCMGDEAPVIQVDESELKLAKSKLVAATKANSELEATIEALKDEIKGMQTAANKSAPKPTSKNLPEVTADDDEILF